MLCTMRPKRLLFLLLLIFTGVVACYAKGRHNGPGRQVQRFLKSHRGIGAFRRNASSTAGLWPSVFNLATKAAVSANATCGRDRREEFCRMADGGGGKGRCGICDNASPDPGKRHSVGFAVDGTNRWWQSPALYYGPQYEFVTITIDLKQVYQIAYVIVKAANSPRPGTWILEKSIDGENFEPWQYFARSDKECIERFGIPATKGKPHYFTDSEVICTSFYSKLTPLENGEIHTSLVHGRPGANETSPELLEFTRTRYVRLRLMGLRGTQEPLPRWFTQDIWKDKRLFYSIRDISVGGQCVCNGHAENCRHNVASGHPECECSHDTCGPNCEECCPMFNQRRWAPGTSRESHRCLPCNCHGRAASCHYDEEVDRNGLSLDVHGNYQGGGVCDNCTDHTAGINCERCAPGYFRPAGVGPEAALPCRRCDCGAAGECEPDGPFAGRCRCPPGYAGPRCEDCAPGYRGYPRCERCPCDPRGVPELGDCEGRCVCKANVEGEFCNRCKPGFFGLNGNYVGGCIPCYCSGVTTLCEPAIVKPQKIRSLKDWLITDLKVSRIKKPTWNGQSVFSLGNHEFSGIKSLYWLAPEEYLGNKLEAYGAYFLFKVQWVVMRGDTSGEPTRGPDMVLIGADGSRIAHGNDVYADADSMTFQIRLDESGWYFLPQNVTDLEEFGYRGMAVTRQEFLKVLANLKHILLRYSFHTDQIESLLEEADLSAGNDGAMNSSVEKCLCPSGYTGLSCESCSFGYVRIYANTSNGDEQGFCGKCDCNGHSATCNPNTGECFCQHNTIGEKCERCSPGYYGNPLRGTPADCKRCACPLANEENNFSPSCQLDYSAERVEDGGNYVCTQCPRGYTGDHCDICDDGYYGNPLEVGNSCRPCDCHGGPCDRLTGQCLSCKGNTEGWKCEKCKPDHYGDPTTANCKLCECDPLGSITKQCDNTTGQCECKERFTGRTCSRCEVGYGNVTALCTACSCHPIGSKSEICDTHSGTCQCRPGVEGFHCDACQNFYYGFSEQGCEPCNCEEDGSKFQTCNGTGVCVCKPNYSGRTCSTCKDGYWKNGDKDCIECNCNEYGSAPNTQCDKEDGRCHCKPGVTGYRCEICMPRHYGSIEIGCKECDPCDKLGHICDPQNGKCVCPSLTKGEHCQHCVEFSWGYEPGIGCKPCSCSETGSSNLQCDETQGRCTCKIGYEGEKCNRCSFGHYGYPDCQKCNCNLLGTVEENCQGADCGCDDSGNCKCKENVQGHKCDSCKPRTFGLTKDNSKGCTPCFCFERSSKCADAHLNWDKIRTQKTSNETDVIDIDYWKLSHKFMGDLTASYGGYLTVEVKGGYFRVTLEGNGVRLQSSGNNELHVVENNWNVASRNPQFPRTCQTNLSRTCFMMILQNVTFVLVEANDRIKEILLDKAKPNIPTYPSSHSIEKCECPKEYTGLSCQEPNEGYFRYFTNKPDDKWIDAVIGTAKPCECNGRSRRCDPNTGICKNCSQNTIGEHCELCDVGYYNDNMGNCSPCLCPTARQNNAESCSSIGNSFICNCREGYKGQFCDRCDVGYFEKPPYSPDSVVCESCNCNSFGTVNGEIGVCDKFGICQCKQGFRGEKCSECVNERQYIKDGVCTPCDECSNLLFSEIDNLESAIEDTFDLVKDGVNPPWKALATSMDKHHTLSEKFKEKKSSFEYLLQHCKIEQYEKKVNKIQKKIRSGNETVGKNGLDTEAVRNSSEELVDDIEELNNELINTVETLENFGTKQISIRSALKGAKEILKHIERISKRFDNDEDDNEEVFHFCKGITQKAHNIYKPLPDLPKMQLKDFKYKLHDLINITSSVESMTNIVEEKNLRNAKNFVNYKEKIEKLKKNNEDLETSIKDIAYKTSSSKDLIIALEGVYGNLKNISGFREYEELDDNIERQMKMNPQIEELYSTALDHVQDMEDKIDSYKSIFNFTKDEWKKINASGAYETLISGINEAKKNTEISREILQNATKLMNPTDSDNIMDKTNLIHAYSDRLKQRINNLKDISKSVTFIKNILDQFKYSILKTGKANNDLNQVLHKVETNITSRADIVAKLEEAIINSTDISDEMQQVEKNIQDMLISSQNRFFKKHSIYLNLTTKEEVHKLKTKLVDTRKRLESLDIHANFHATKNFHIEHKNRNLQNIQDKIEQLKNKIYYAKQAADAINVAMNISHCRMTYQLPQMELFQSLSITFKCNTCQLFKLSGDDGEINLAADDYNIVLKFNNRKILVPNSAEEKEKTINIQKLGSLIKMQVDDLGPSLAETDSEFHIIQPTDKIEIGSTDNEIERKSYIHKVMLNGRKFGLWSFVRTEGHCTGETRDESDKLTSNVNILFNGKGYVIYGKNNKLNPSKLTLRFDFTTFDENSLIYLASFQENSLMSKEENCSYIILFLKNGYLNFIVKHSNGLNSTLALDNKYNDGRRYQAEIITEYDVSTGVQYYILFAKNETVQERKKNSNKLSRKYVFKIKQTSHYIGGVRPTFNKTCLPINTNSFLGFLKVTSQLTNEIISYGTTKTSKQILEFYQAWIDTNGYVKIKSLDEKIESISFILRPTSPNGVVMNLGQYNISLNNYKLKIDGNTNTFDSGLDKDEYNIVKILVKEGVLMVNRNENNVNFPEGIRIKNRIIGIGNKYQGFSGGINNILINDRELLFDPQSVTEFSGVRIGREPPPIERSNKEKSVKSLSTHITNSMQNTERCVSFANYEPDPDAVKFGDKSDSYTHIKTNFWKQDYKITFQFRTFYPYGVIFIAIGSQKHQHYNLLELTEGHLGLHFKGRKKMSQIVLKEKLNDGQWHNVEIFKRKRKVTIILDGDQKKTLKVPKTAVRSEIYLGSIPVNSNYLNVRDLKYKLHSFRGCMKSLIINDEHQLLKNKDVVHNNIRQCFPNIEEGAYFGGDAFAIYKENFRINKILELSFEFRTGEQNGILLSVSNYRNSPALSVELQNGAVVMAVDMGNGASSNVTNNLDSDFALCNNMWHNVTAMYSSSELTLNVDGILKIWVQSDLNSLMDEVDAPLYIGGLPDNAPVGTLKSRENFKGCIRKLKIENKLMDWSDMRELNNVLLNSCPIEYKKQRHRNGSANYTVPREILDKPKTDRV